MKESTKQCRQYLCKVCNNPVEPIKSHIERRLCRQHFNAAAREYRKAHQEQHHQAMLKWRAKNKEKVKEMQLNYVTKRFGSNAKCMMHYWKPHVENLTTAYIKQLLKLPFADIPQDLIELKRTQLQLHRQLRTHEKRQEKHPDC